MTARALSGSDSAVDDTPVALDGDAFDRVEQEFRAGRFGLFMQQRTELGAGDALRKSRKILDPLGRRDLAADTHALDHHHRQPAARGVRGCGQPGDARADHDKVEFPHCERLRSDVCEPCVALYASGDHSAGRRGRGNDEDKERPQESSG